MQPSTSAPPCALVTGAGSPGGIGFSAGMVPVNDAVAAAIFARSPASAEQAVLDHIRVSEVQLQVITAVND